MPLAWCAAVLMLAPFALRSWRSWGAPALRVAFALAAALGVAGLVFHSHGDLAGAARAPVGTQAPVPPVLAPLAFVGLGLLGIVACAER
jgi:hypothetical protein